MYDMGEVELWIREDISLLASRLHDRLLALAVHLSISLSIIQINVCFSRLARVGLSDLQHSLHASSQPAAATHTAPPPTNIHALNSDRKKHGIHWAKPTDRDARRERGRSCFVARVLFLRPDALPVTNPPNDVSSGKNAESSFMS